MNNKVIPNVLTIAGSDSGGGAGIQADLKTFSAQRVYGASVITAVTAQNTRSVTAIHYIPPSIIQAQIEAVLADITISVIKIGMLGNQATIKAVLNGLGDAKCSSPLVLDPVMISKGGSHLLVPDAVDELKRYLIPIVYLMTPNLPEAALLTGEKEPQTVAEMEALLPKLHDLGAENILLKGGHLKDSSESIDLLSNGKHIWRFSSPRMLTNNTHGTGCTLSAAISANLAQGLALPAAVSCAKDYVVGAIRAADQLSVGQGHGPLNHLSALWAAHNSLS